MKPVIRFLRLCCRTPDDSPEPYRDGVLAIAAVHEPAGLARLLLTDMGPWGRNEGASVTQTRQVVVPAAHRWLISGFGVPLAETQVVELDGGGHFDLLRDLKDGTGLRLEPLVHAAGVCAPRSREAFLRWAGDAGHAMLKTVDAMRDGAWPGVEG